MDGQKKTKEKVALVTGGGKRIGAACVRALAQEGFFTVIHYHKDEKSAASLQKELIGQGYQAGLFQADLSAFHSLRLDMEKLLDKISGIDVLVNNASVFLPTPLDFNDEEKFDDILHVNLRAAMILTQMARKSLKERRGVVINISDIHVIKPIRNHMAYILSKTGLEGLSRVLARELAPEICVHTIRPGAMLPPKNMTEETKERMRKKIPLGRWGGAAPIAEAVRFLSTRASYMTGSIWNIDGGQSI